MCEAYIAPLSDTPTELPEQLLDRLEPERRERIARLRSPADRYRALCGHLLARALLCRRLDAANGELRFSLGANGKPQLDSHDVGFNISHTPHCVAVAIADGSVGVDVEGSRRARMSVARRFFTRDERRFVYAADFGRDRRFFYVWTRKEACIKYTGEGLSRPLPSFDALEGDFAPRLRSFDHVGYTVSVCADEPPDKLYILTETELLEMANRLTPLG